MGYDEFLQSLRLDFTKLQPREYQVRAAMALLERGNTLVVMPTALGKTFVAVLAIAKLLQRNPSAKFLFLAPTKPLVLQQANRLRELLVVPNLSVEAVTGEMPPEQRKQVYASAQAIAATPQTVNNDLRFIDFKQFALVVFDEAHRAVGDYAFVPVAKEVLKNNVLLLALTASPSAEREKIDEVRSNLGISHIEIKTEKDEDVRDYVQKVELDFQFVELPQEFRALRIQLDALAGECLESIRKSGFQLAPASALKKKDLLDLRLKLLQSIRGKDFRAYGAMSALARLMNLLHAGDLLESQGIAPLRKFLEGFEARKADSKAVAVLSKDVRVKKLLAQCRELEEKSIEHPKYEKLRQIVGENAAQQKSIIVFANYRATVAKLERDLNQLPGVSAKQLIGRSGVGMTQKQQAQIIQQFRDKLFNVMVCSSVGEEGLDIPAVDLVVFFEAVPSEIRAIQRRGRAGRVKAGKAIILVAKATRDEAFLWVARRKERKMHGELKRMRGQLARNQQPADAKPEGKEEQKKLGEY